MAYRKQAEKGNDEKNSYAATFHLAWLIKNEPENAGLLSEFQDAYTKLEAEYKQEKRDLEAVLAPVVNDAIKLIPETKPDNEADGDDDE